MHKNSLTDHTGGVTKVIHHPNIMQFLIAFMYHVQMRKAAIQYEHKQVLSIFYNFWSGIESNRST